MHVAKPIARPKRRSLHALESSAFCFSAQRPHFDHAATPRGELLRGTRSEAKARVWSAIARCLWIGDVCDGDVCIGMTICAMEASDIQARERVVAEPLGVLGFFSMVSSA
jgi:hypothetical protein